MSGQTGFSKKQLADQNTKVADLVKEEAKLAAAIDRGEKTLAENREKLKDTQRSRAAENAKLEQMIQRGIKAASKGDTSQRAALIAALLMGDGPAAGQADAGQADGARDRAPNPPKSAEPAPSKSDPADDARSDDALFREPAGSGDGSTGDEGGRGGDGSTSDEDGEAA